MNRRALFFQSMILLSLLIFMFLTGYIVGWNSAVRSAGDVAARAEQLSTPGDLDAISSQLQSGKDWHSLAGNNPASSETVSNSDAKIPDSPFPESAWSGDRNLPDGERVNIVFKADGSILYGIEVETLPMIRDQIKESGALKPFERVIIRAERKAHYQDVLAVLHSCQAAHLTQVTFGPSL